MSFLRSVAERGQGRGEPTPGVQQGTCQALDLAHQHQCTQFLPQTQTHIRLTEQHHSREPLPGPQACLPQGNQRIPCWTPAPSPAGPREHSCRHGSSSSCGSWRSHTCCSSSRAFNYLPAALAQRLRGSGVYRTDSGHLMGMHARSRGLRASRLRTVQSAHWEVSGSGWGCPGSSSVSGDAAPSPINSSYPREGTLCKPTDGDRFSNQPRSARQDTKPGFAGPTWATLRAVTLTLQTQPLHQ